VLGALRRLEERIGLGFERSRPLRESAARRRRAELGLAGLLSAGAALRGWLMLSYRPAFAGYPDARAYVMAARGPLYWNPYKPVGYPLFLRGLRAIDRRLSVTIAAQHLLGMASGALAFATAVPLVRRRALALLPAGLVLLGGAQVFLEHSLLSDAPYTFLLELTLYCSVRSLSDRTEVRWLAGAGAALAASVTMRTVGAFLVPVLAAWAASAPGRAVDARARRAGAVLGSAAIPLLAYVAAQHRVTGTWGLTRSSNFAFYARMAPIADCTRFRPPAGTEDLCEPNDPRSRPNANWYIFDLSSPANRRYGPLPWPLERVPPSEYRWPGDEPTRRFARAALAAQPLDYLATVLQGLANYVAPRAGRRSVFEYDQQMLVSELRNPGFEEAALPDITAYYSTRSGYRRRNVRALAAYGRAARTEGPLTAALGLAAFAGWGLSVGEDRAAARLFLATALSLATLPVALLFYDVRYAAPMVVPLAAAAAMGIDRLCDHVPPRSSGR
jgi:Dolichyl-phosphate-mannose-protein mannosyltransferase